MVANLSKPQLLFLLKYKNFEKKNMPFDGKRIKLSYTVELQAHSKDVFWGQERFPAIGTLW